MRFIVATGVATAFTRSIPVPVQQFPEGALKEMQTVRKREGIKQNSSAMSGFQSYFPIDTNEIFAI
jgi:hypothetical protein